MLLSEYDYDTDIAVQREEAGKIAFAEGIEQGFSDGALQAKIETAKLMRAHNYPVAEICAMTGLPVEEIEKL